MSLVVFSMTFPRRSHSPAAAASGLQELFRPRPPIRLSLLVGHSPKQPQAATRHTFVGLKTVAIGLHQSGGSIGFGMHLFEAQADMMMNGRTMITVLGRGAKTGAPPVSLVLDPDTARAGRASMKRLEGKYAAIEGLVYASRARGSHRADSDADLAVILRGERGDRYAAIMSIAN